MALKANRQQNQVLNDLRDPAQAFKVTQRECNHCGSPKHLEDQCRAKNPHPAPEWFQLKLKYHLIQKK